MFPIRNVFGQQRSRVYRVPPRPFPVLPRCGQLTPQWAVPPRMALCDFSRDCCRGSRTAGCWWSCCAEGVLAYQLAGSCVPVRCSVVRHGCFPQGVSMVHAGLGATTSSWRVRCASRRSSRVSFRRVCAHNVLLFVLRARPALFFPT